MLPLRGHTASVDTALLGVKRDFEVWTYEATTWITQHKYIDQGSFICVE